MMDVDICCLLVCFGFGHTNQAKVRLLLAAGESSVTQSHCSVPSQFEDEPSPVSSLRLARRSVGGVLLAELWGDWLSTRWAGEPACSEVLLLGDNHCLIVGGVLCRTAAVLESCERLGVVVLEERGRAAPLGAQAAG